MCVRRPLVAEQQSCQLQVTHCGMVHGYVRHNQTQGHHLSPLYQVTPKLYRTFPEAHQSHTCWIHVCHLRSVGFPRPEHFQKGCISNCNSICVDVALVVEAVHFIWQIASACSIMIAISEVHNVNVWSRTCGSPHYWCLQCNVWQAHLVTSVVWANPPWYWTRAMALNISHLSMCSWSRIQVWCPNHT